MVMAHGKFKLKTNFLKKHRGDTTFDIINYAIFILIGFIMIYPFYYVLKTSLVGHSFANNVSRTFITLDGYKIILQKAELVRALFVTVIVVVLSIIGHLCVTLLAAYSLSKNNLKGKTFFMLFIIFSMLFSGGLIPYYLLIRNILHLDNTIWVYILPDLANGYNTIIAINFIRGLPDGVEEAAMIDGANHFQILMRIVFPLSFPIMATIGLWIGVGKWNAWFESTLFINKRELMLFQSYLQTILNSSATMGDQIGSDLASLSENAKMAAIVIGILPIVITYPFLQKYFVKGALIGSIKG